MKKISSLLLITILVFTLCSCRGGVPETAAPAEDAVVSQVPEGDVAGAEEDTAPPVETKVIDMYEGQWNGYDGFSNERIPDLTIRIVDITDTSVIFDYNSSAVSAQSVTAVLDGNGCASVDLDNGVTLDMTFTEDSITLDELQGMGAMAYYFVPAI